MSFLKHAFTLTAAALLAGCSANMDVNPNRTSTSYRSTTTDDNRASVTMRSDNDRYATSDRYAVADTTATNNGRVNRWDTPTYTGPILTDPIGRPEDRYQRVGDEGAMTASARMEANTNVNTDNNSLRRDTTGPDANVRTETSDRTTTSDTTITSNGSASLSQQDRDFITKAASAGNFEVRSAKLVQDKITDKDEKDFAQMMIDDHTKANDDLKSLAERKGVTISDSLAPKHQSLYDQLNSSNDVLGTYKQQQVAAHQQTIKLFEDELRNGRDADVKAFAEKYLPVLRQHLEGAEAHLNMK